ncbi:hypothetical protein TNCV_2599501 [Trichonephila clavipes]|uniref:Uncharacterized protein n=1 Tax=Trichonephila clavipes TaxID=2585209 RepID=A0A8X6UT27_TRICX|nr:hypothetical protein TNCV_2599501 [Trichonephila clavipes]
MQGTIIEDPQTLLYEIPISLAIPRVLKLGVVSTISSTISSFNSVCAIRSRLRAAFWNEPVSHNCWCRRANMVLDESRSFFRVHTGYFSNIPKCIKAEFIASWGCSQSSVVSSSQR